MRREGEFGALFACAIILSLGIGYGVGRASCLPQAQSSYAYGATQHSRAHKSERETESPSGAVIGPTGPAEHWIGCGKDQTNNPWLDPATWAAVATALFTGALFFVTNGLLRIGGRQAQAALNAGRPFLTPIDEELKPMAPLRHEGSLAKWMGFYARVINRGMGPAFLQRMGIAHEVIEHGGGPRGLPFDMGDPLGRLLIGSEAHWGTEGDVPLMSIQLSPDEIQKIQDKWHVLHIYGIFRYADLYGVIRDTGFHYSFNPDTAQLITERGEALWRDSVHSYENDGGSLPARRPT